MSLKNIPTNWCVSTIGDINNYNSLTFNPKSFQEDTFELYSVPSFASGSPEVLLGKDIASNKQYIKFKDILLCKINPRINRVWCVKENTEFPQIGSSEWIVIRQPLIHEGFLTYFLQTQSFRDLLCSDVSGVGGSLTRAQPKRVATYHVPIAPFQEQKIIAEKLDTLLAQVDSTKARLELIPQILKRFRQAVLRAAVTGRLIDKDFTNLVTNIGSHVSIDIGNAFKSAEFSEDGIPLLRGQNIEPGALRWDDTKKFPAEKLELFSHLFINENDIILAMDRPIISSGLKLAKAKKSDLPCVLVQRVARFKDYRDLLPEYLYIALSGLDFENYIQPNQTGSDIPHISGKQILNFKCSIPPHDDQLEIVRRVEQLFAWADTIEKQVNNALTRVNSLTQSILAKAFRGELTAQWRAENPSLISGENSAAALLEKIKAERAASGGKKTSRKKA
ncbi:TPA: restriction endonuclease subunit S [Salmonella enterica subsp. enterica serovar Orion]|uniref:Restriction endonuclease subunit S n=1 Tax=Salmonella enterica subsp. enterica serovar Orion TaxID=399586 RepID=A0A3T2WA51_SALET|nr:MULTISPECIES: restriction endonuclease subunit S [Salmonella]EAA0559973.1 restriction endonuclease subunit S [Salmonella enterica subsp. enterica serovar Lexington]EAA7885965.1 restriction endonuclease subunit S [Salmonella enterica]EAC1856944.1 restriction endonuclease subunit S [Salmonella enterica subsp. enterica]EBL3747140.1 restriction endonuclease subunit S [Salmonella enterica subsp. enterica serovar Typhimurium]EBM0680580.1 restriction endonuclease subunit S [Salmonella enterica sub